jgi:hypothetical protein
MASNVVGFSLELFIGAFHWSFLLELPDNRAPLFLLICKTESPFSLVISIVKVVMAGTA